MLHISPFISGTTTCEVKKEIKLFLKENNKENYNSLVLILLFRVCYFEDQTDLS